MSVINIQNKYFYLSLQFKKYDNHRTAWMYLHFILPLWFLSLTLGVRASTHRDGDWVLVKCHWRLKDGSGLVFSLLPVILSTSESMISSRVSVRVLMNREGPPQTSWSLWWDFDFRHRELRLVIHDAFEHYVIHILSMWMNILPICSMRDQARVSAPACSCECLHVWMNMNDMGCLSIPCCLAVTQPQVRILWLVSEAAVGRGPLLLSDHTDH